jgi:hypothetical protein
VQTSRWTDEDRAAIAVVRRKTGQVQGRGEMLTRIDAIEIGDAK